jgi:enoyl-CoA hydratase/carnithine racemase
MADPLRVERDGDLTILTMDSPPLNLFTHQMWANFEDAVAELTADTPRAVLIRAEGRVVSGGVDVALFADLTPATAKELWERHIQTVHALESLPCPVVFAAHALCLTAAFEISLGCDLLLATRSASFGLVERRVGLTPAMGGTQRLASRAGPARAREFVMTGDVYDAETMHAWGVVNRLYDDEGFAEAAVAFTQELAEGPTIAHAATKQIVAAQVEGGVLDADRVMPAIAGDLFATDDLKGAVRSFIEHRGPGHATFTGRQAAQR